MNQSGFDRILYQVLLAILIVLAANGLVVVSQFIGRVPAPVESEGGTITYIEILYEPEGTYWAGVYGMAVRVQGYTNLQSEIITNAQMLERHFLFDCLPSHQINEIFASTTNPNNIDFNTLTAASPADVDAFIGVASDDMQSGTRTLTENITVNLGTTVITNIPATYTYEANLSMNHFFDIGALKDGAGHLVFVAHIAGNFSYGFNQRIYNYQMLLPVPNNTNQTYYFFADPFNNCPGGVGELEPNGTVTGIVTDELGVPVNNVLVHTGGVNNITDVLGNYSIWVNPGTFMIFAVKTGYEVYMNNVTVLTNGTTIHNIVLIKKPEPTNQSADYNTTKENDEQNKESGKSDNTNAAPKTPIVEKPKKIEGTDYIITVAEIKRKLRIGNFLQQVVTFISFKDTTAQVNLELTGDTAPMIDMDKQKFLIDPNGKQDVTLTIFGRGSPGIYNGTLEITGDLNASIPIEIELLDREQLPVEALQIDLDLLNKQLHAGDLFKFKTDLRNFLMDRQYAVELIYTIQNEKGDQTYYTYQTNTFVRTHHSLLHSMRLPKTMPTGDYILRVTANYLGLSSGTSAIFTVVLPFYQYRIFGMLPMWQLFIILGVIGGGIVAYFFVRRRMESKKKFHLKVEMSELPKPGPRSIFVGKIAETDNKTYFDIDKFTTHCIVAGSTGGGKSFSAQCVIEEMLLKNIAVIVFDPTAQWTGMLRKCTTKGLLDLYPDFGYKKTDARAFNGNIREVKDARELIDVKKFIKPGEIQVFACHRLDPKDMDTFVANTVREIFHSNFQESRVLKLELVYDEVHRLLPKFGGSGEGFLQIERACREFRKWGVGVMLISQVLADFVGQIKANINTEIQMRTRDEGDLERIRVKYGEEVLRSLVKATVGAGMVENPAWNRGKPYFVQFRPVLHSVSRLDDEEIDKYNKYNDLIDDLTGQLDQLEKEHGIDVFDLKMELKLALDKVKSGNFNMVDIYVEGLKPRIEKHWQKLGKQPKKYERKLVDTAELQKELEKAKKAREEFEKQHQSEQTKAFEKMAKEPKKWDEDVPPEKILKLHNGMLVVNLASLYDEIFAMKKEDYEFHMNADKKDFADWIRDACGDDDLAEHVRQAAGKEKVLELLLMKKEGKKYPPLEKKAEAKKDEAKKEGEKKDEAKEEKKDGKGGSAGNEDEKPSHKAIEEKAAEKKLEKAEEKKPEHHKEGRRPEAMVNASLGEEQHFVLGNGSKLGSLVDLKNYLQQVNEEEFKNYVSEGKNDFESWVRNMVGNPDLADELSKTKSKENMFSILEDHLKNG